jgi:polyhydroxybutyrate depolymerase
MNLTMTKSIAFAFLISMLLAFSCKKSKVSSTEDSELKTINHDGEEREYLIHFPASADDEKPLALLLCFHGYGNTANEIMDYSKFNEIADAHNFIVVYPQGLKHEWITHWNVGGFIKGSSADDVGFVNAMLDELEAEYSIDTERVYATGASNGGFMSFMLACELSDRFAAIASVIGSMTPEVLEVCDPSHQMPILQLHGTADDVVPYNGQSDMLPIDSVLSYWKTHNQTNLTATAEEIADADQNDGSTVEKYIYNNGLNGASVIHYKVLNGGHDWFGAEGNMDIQSSQIVWEFLSRYDINGEL